MNDKSISKTSAPLATSTRATTRRPLWQTAAWGISAGVFIGVASLPKSAHAVDGCLVLLCFAAPSWSAIPQCVPPIRQVLRDLARGRPFPICSMAGGGNSATHRWSSAPAFCPSQYTSISGHDGNGTPLCAYDGAVEVRIEGDLWTRTWWSRAGNNVTEYTPAAKAQLGTWDTRFDDDYASWLASQPPVAPPCDICT